MKFIDINGVARLFGRMPGPHKGYHSPAMGYSGGNTPVCKEVENFTKNQNIFQKFRQFSAQIIYSLKIFEKLNNFQIAEFFEKYSNNLRVPTINSPSQTAIFTLLQCNYFKKLSDIPVCTNIENEQIN